MENNELQIFENDNFGDLRVILKDGQPWFIANDVLDALDLKNDTHALDNLDSDEKSVLRSVENDEAIEDIASSKDLQPIEIIDTMYNTHCPNDFSYLRKDTRIVSESGLYSLIFRSRKPEAKAFRKWVTSVVLPSIHKTGKFGATNADADGKRPLSTKAKIEFLEKIMAVAREHGCYNALAINELILRDTGCDILDEAGQNVLDALGKPEYTPKQIAKIIGRSVNSIDDALVRMGLQVYGLNQYRLTEKGLKYGYVYDTGKRRSLRYPFQHISNIKWHPIIIDKLRMHFNLDATKALEQDGDSYFKVFSHMKTLTQ